MCSGGGGATIYAPKTEAYDRMAQAQFDAMRAVQEGGAKIKQQELNAATLNQQAVLAQLKDVQTRQANDVSAQAGRLAALIGAPPPEKSAEAPVVGRARGTATSKGKGALRIERQLTAAAGQGSGLNIT
jgi:hypothetical protein